jgi:poly(3-hydroxybutyrate) depolymerase
MQVQVARQLGLIVVALSAIAACHGREPPTAAPAPSSPTAGPHAQPLSSSTTPPAVSIQASASSAAPAAPGPPRTAAQSRKDFPCEGCEFRLPATEDSLRPAPLLILLHGDLGDVWRMTRAWGAAAESQGVLLASLRCPRDKGCSSSWWKWYLSRWHEDSWIGDQIDAISREYPVNPRRVYAAGYSGGASYLGYYVPRHPERLAAASHVAGGVNFYPTCSSCKTPVHFLIGSQDPMIPLYTRALRTWYEGCGGHPLVWQVLPGVTHDSIVGIVQTSRSKELMAWLLRYELDCPAAAPPVSSSR